MAKGGKRENAGRKPKLNGNSIKLFARVSEKLENDIESFGIGENKSEKLRYVIEKGIEIIKKEKE